MNGLRSEIDGFQSKLRRRSEGARPAFVHLRLVSLFPWTALLLFGFALTASGAPAKRPDFHRVLDQIDKLTLGRVLVLLLASLILACLVRPFQFGLVRLLEGYWDAIALGRLLSLAGIRFHRRRLARLQTTACRPVKTDRERWRRDRALERLAAYPAEDRLLPTRLGNTLRAAEDEAGQRYGLATVTMWPRLYPHLAERFAQVVDDARNQLDLTVRLCAVLAVASLISAVLLVAHGPWLVVSAVTAAGLGGLSGGGAVSGQLRRDAAAGLRPAPLRHAARTALSLAGQSSRGVGLQPATSQFFAEGPDPEGELLGDAYEHPEPEAGSR
jgi:hypothetical protein